MIDNKNNQRRPWSEAEDRALKSLYQSLKINKWSQIAQKLQLAYGFMGRTGKQCRQRYNNHLDPSLSRDEWTLTQEKRLYELHDELGNKWAIISQKLNTGRTDNTIKNHFYSRLRKSLRRLNQAIQEKYKREVREIQTKVLYKIIEASEERFKPDPMCDQDLSHYSCQLKNKILMFSYEEEQAENYQDQDSVKQLIQQIVDFNKKYKRKPKRFRKGGSSYDYTEIDREKSNKSITKLQYIDRNIRQVSASFSSFSVKPKASPEIKIEEASDEDYEISPMVKVETQQQKIISPIILTGSNPVKLEQCVDKEREEKVGKGQQMLQALGLLQQDILMPHPIFMKKNTSLMSSEHSQEQQYYNKFFEDSEAEMKLMMGTPLPTALKKESIDEHLFH